MSASGLESVDWNELVEDCGNTDYDYDDDDEGRTHEHAADSSSGGSTENGYSGVQIIEQPASPPEPELVRRRKQRSVGRNKNKNDNDINGAGVKMSESVGLSCSEDGDDDVLDLYYNETDLQETRETDCYTGSNVVGPEDEEEQPTAGRFTVAEEEEDVATTDWGRRRRVRGVENNAPAKPARKKVLYEQQPPPSRCIRKRHRTTDEGLVAAATTSTSAQPASRRRRRRRPVDVVVRRKRPGELQHGGTAKYNDANNRGGGRWIVRSVRNGYEQLVYDICDCNETPNVVFAGICHQRADVYTMVLKNCVGKRRYWYDKSARRVQLPAGAEMTDFERAMRWRASDVGRMTTSPGYDLAAFLLQNVATDRRCGPTRTPSLVLVTTGDMLSDPSTNRQLVYRGDKTTARRATRFNPYLLQKSPAGPAKTKRCCVCHGAACVVTDDTAGVSTFTCWDHAASYLADAGADAAHVCNTAVVDLSFLLRRTSDREPENDELVCRLRLVTATDECDGGGGGEDGGVTIAELVFLPLGTHISHLAPPADSTGTSSDVVVRLETAHTYGCQDRHYNHGDLFASMPSNNRGGGGGAGIQQYDTVIGRMVDRLHCVVSCFQKRILSN